MVHMLTSCLPFSSFSLSMTYERDTSLLSDIEASLVCRVTHNLCGEIQSVVEALCPTCIKTY